MFEGRINKDKYSFHWQKDNLLIFRYDNSPHYREIKTFPHHKHIGKDINKVTESNEITLKQVLKEIKEVILHG